METTEKQSQAPDDREKLIPEWGLKADDQIIALGLAVLLGLFLLFGWRSWRGGDDPIEATPAIVAVEEESQEVVKAVEDDATATPSTTAEAAITTTLPAALDLSPDVASAVGPFAVQGRAEAETAILTGYVGTAEESESAEEAAAQVPGIISVDNQLVILQPAVQTALEDAGVAESAATVEGTVATAVGIVGNDAERDEALSAAAAVEGVTQVNDRLHVLTPDVLASLETSGVDSPEAAVTGTVATVRGVVADEDARAAALAAAASLNGVTEVIDELTIGGNAVEQLNTLFELEPIQFATSSAEILPASFATLDAAFEILQASPETKLEVQGYTDTQGPESSNLALSQARADSVLASLLDKGVATDTLTAVGYGETTQFGEGSSPEALAANRRVQFIKL